MKELLEKLRCKVSLGMTGQNMMGGVQSCMVTGAARRILKRLGDSVFSIKARFALHHRKVHSLLQGNIYFILFHVIPQSLDKLSFRILLWPVENSEAVYPACRNTGY